ncbi:MAG: putative T7SS-secreted protein [Pseudonocardiaceae bacterium]
MAELGQTTDPKALIGGDPGALRTTIATLNKFGGALTTGGDGLAKLDDGGWTGQAADAFHEWFDGEPARWIACGAAFSSAAGALTTYVGVLEWAQRQAGEAIRLWTEAEAATSQAKANHQRAVNQANQQAAAAGTIAPSIPFVDPGEAKRTEAQDLLAAARSQLRDAGDRANTTVGQARDQAPEKPSLLERAGETLGDFGEGVWEGVTGLAEFVWQVSPVRFMIDPAGYVHDMMGLAAGLSTAVTNPKEFFQTVIDWDTWKDNPARALGRLVPDLALALGTAGAGAVAARGGRAAQAASRLGRGCFVAGTMVSTVDGPQPIENLVVGDKVVAGDPIAATHQVHPITATFIHTVPAVLDLCVKGTRITCSPEHPLWVSGVGWREAGTLDVGDALLTQEGYPTRIDSVQRHQGAFIVYNIEVAGIHTYCVSDLGIIAHNKAMRVPRPEGTPKKVSDKYLKSKGVDPHTFKRGLPGPRARFDIYVDRNGNMFGVPKGGKPEDGEYLGNIEEGS